MRRAALLLSLLALSGCVQLEPPRREDERALPGQRGGVDQLEPSLESFLVVPSSLSCEEALVAISPDFRRELRLEGALREEGDTTFGGPATLRFRTLTVRCQRLRLVIHDEARERFLLAAAGDAELTRVETHYRAQALEIGPNGLQLIGPSSTTVTKPPLQRR